MKVLFVVPSFHTNLYGAVRALVARGVEVVLYVESRGRARVEGVRVETSGNLSFTAAWRLLREEDPDFIVIRRTKKRRLARPIHLAALAQGRSVAGYSLKPFWRRAEALGAWAERLAAFAHGLPNRRLTPCRGLKTPGVSPDPRATYIPWPVAATAPDEPRDHAPDGVVRVLCVGKLAESRKNQRLLIRALEALAPEFRFTLTLAGSSGLGIGKPDAANLAWLRDYSRAGAVGERVSVVENVPFEAMPALYRTHDICVLPASKEPLGIAPLEAMGRGCFTIVTNECGCAGTIAAAEEAGLRCGEVCAAGDAEALEAALRRVFEAPGDLPMLGRNAREWARRELSEERFAERFLAFAARCGAAAPVAGRKPVGAAERPALSSPAR